VTTGTLSEYAAHIKASPAYVTKLKKQGRIVTRDVDGTQRVDFELSDRLIRNTTDLGRAANGANAKPGREASTPVAPMADVGRVDAIFRQAQAQERAFNAKLAELEYKKAIGDLVAASDVRAAYTKRAVTLREALLQIPARLAPVLAAETDQAKCHDLIQSELHTVLQQIADA
jgi:phage terminase Nu1 subunit (DNA packaging protein)